MCIITANRILTMYLIIMITHKYLAIHAYQSLLLAALYSDAQDIVVHDKSGRHAYYRLTLL